MSGRDRRVAYLSPQWGAVSETWAARMVDQLRPHLAAVMAGTVGVGRRFSSVMRSGLAEGAGDPKQVDLLYGRPASGRAGVVARRLWRRSTGGAYWNVLRESRRTLAASGADRLLVNFADFALRTRPAWTGLFDRVVVHCHGSDVAFRGRRDEDGAPFHEPGYPDELAAFAASADAPVFVANSRDTRRRLLAAGVPRGAIELKYFGVPVAAGATADRPGREFLRVLYLGRLVECKGPHLLIDSVAAARRAGADVRLTVVGDGPLRAECERRAADGGCGRAVEFRGALPFAEAQPLLTDADLFAAHHHEGPETRRVEAFGVAVLEAMAAGLPVLGGRSGGVPDSVVDGVTGVLVEPGDVPAFSDALIDLCRRPDRRRAMGAAGLARVRGTFTVERERDRLFELLGLRGGANVRR